MTKEKDKEIKKLKLQLMTAIVLLLVLIAFFVVQGFMCKRAVALSGVSGKMSELSEEDFCIRFYNRTLEDGYCDITSIDYNSSLWDDMLATEEFLYEHYVDCSWGKVMVKNFNPEGNNLDDRMRYWYVDCDFNQTKKVVINGEDGG